jgi:hypothetical protein
MLQGHKITAAKDGIHSANLGSTRQSLKRLMRMRVVVMKNGRFALDVPQLLYTPEKLTHPVFAQN